MANGGRIDFTVGYKVDKTGLNDLKASLTEISKLTAGEILKLNPNLSGINEAHSAMMKIRTDINNIDTAFKDAFDPTTGITNITTLSQNLKKLDLSKISSNFSKLGPTGQKAFSQIAAKAMTTNLQFKETNNILDKMGRTLGNTLKWNISSSLINKFTGSIQQAWGYVQHLDTSLNDIRIVTEKSADEMEEFAIKANDAAKALGASTTEYTEAALIYYQQGLGDEESAARAETTIKAANVTGQSAQQVSEQLTAVWNGYKVTAEETEMYVDKLAAVAASTASDLEELSTGMSKVASAANNMGVDIDQLNGMLATIISVTRQAPETAGTALKTIFARMEDLKISGEDENGVKLGEVSSTLDELGIKVLDAQGNIRDLGTVIEEVAGKWNTWTKAQQNAAAQAMAGKRQYNNLLALFDNWDMYTAAVQTSEGSLGTLQTQQNIYMESTEAHLQQLKTQWEDLYDSLFNTKDVNSLLDIATKLVDIFTNFTDSIGGGKGLLLGLGAVATNVFNKQISQGLEGIITKFSNAKTNAQALASEIEITQQYFNNMGANPKAVDEIVQLKQQMQQYYDVMTQEEIQAKNELIDQASEIIILKDEWEAAGLAYEDYVKKLAKSQVGKNNTFKGTGENSQFAKLNSMNFTDEGIGELGEKAINESIKAAEKLQQAFNKVKESIKEYQDALSSGDSQAQTDAFNKMTQAENEYYEAEQKIIDNAALDIEQQKQLANAYNKTIEKVKNLIDAYVDDNATGDQRRAKSGAVTRALKQEEQAVEGVTGAVIHMGEEYKKDLPEVQEEFKKTTAEADKLKRSILATQEFDTRQLISGLSSLVSGITSVGFAFSSISSISKTWADETLSGTEKVIQTMISLGMILPGIKAALEGINAVRAIYNGLLVAQGMAEGTLLSINGIAVPLYAARAIAVKLAEEGSEDLNEELVKQILNENLSAEGLTNETIALAINTAAKNKNRQAVELLNNGTQEASGSIKQFVKLLSGSSTGAAEAGAEAGAASGGFASLAESIGLSTVALGSILAILAAVIAGVVAYNVILAKERELEASNAKARAAEAKEITEQYENEKTKIDELADSYKSLQEQYKNHSLSGETLRDKVHDLAIQYGDEELAVKSLTASYDELNNAINKLSTKNNEELIASSRREQEALQDQFGAELWRDMKKGARDEVWDDESASYVRAIDLKGFGAKNAEERRLSTQLQDLGIKQYGDHINFEDFERVATENREELQQILDSNNSKAAQQLSKYLDDYKDTLDRYDQLADTVTTAQQDSRNKGLDEANVKSYEEAQKAYEDYVKAATEEGLTWEEANQQFKQYANEMDNTFMRQMAETQTMKDYLESGYLKTAKANGIDTTDWDIHEKTDELVEQLQAAGYTMKDVGFLTDEQWKQYYLGNLSWEEIVSEIEEGQKQNLEQTRNDFLNNDIKQFNSDLNSIIGKAVKGELTSDDEDYQKLAEQVESIKEAFPEAANEAEIFLNEGLIGTEKWTQALYDLQQKFDQLEFQRLNDEFKDQLNDISPELDDTQFKQEMDELLDADYEISVKIHSDGIEDFENAEAALDDIDSMASKIGEDFIVAAEDIRELNNTFPGILEGMEYLSDGTVKLNEDVARSAMDMATQEEQASTKATITKLQNSATELRAKAEVYDNMAKLAYESAQNDTKIEDNKQEILKNFKEIETQNDKIATDAENANSEAVVEQSKEDAPILAQNWTEAYQTAAHAANDWAEVAAAASEHVKTGGASPLKSPDFGATYKGNYQGASERKTGVEAQLNDAKTSADWTQLGDQFTNQAEVYRKNANDLEGAAAELAAKTVKSSKTNTTVGDKKDSSSKSSSSKEDKPDTEKYLEREKDAYREINEELDNIESKLGRIQKANDHAWGATALKTLRQENKLLEKQYDLLKKKKKISEEDLSTRRKQLEDQGVEFSKDGSTMTNAEARLDELYAEYNAMVDQYNSMSKEQQEDFKKTLESKKETVDRIEKAMSEYESKFNDYNSLLDELQEKHYELIENAVNRFNHKINLKLELNDAKKEWKKFWHEVVKDVRENDFAGQIAKSMSQLRILTGVGGNANKSEIAQLTKHVEKTTAEVQKQIQGAKNGGGDSIFGDDTKLSMETLTEYRDKLMEAVRSAKEEIENMQEVYLKTLDDAQDKIDKQAKGWESIGDYLEHNVELIKMISGEKAYDLIGKQYEKIYQNNLKTLETDRMSADYWKERVEYYQNMVNITPKTDKMYETYAEALEKSKENFTAAIEKRNEDLINSLKAAQETFKNTSAEIADDFSKAMSKGLGLNRMKNQWDLAIEKQNLYLDNVERAIEMQDLLNDFDDVANGLSGRVELQKEFLQFQDEEIGKLKEREKLTQYDIDELRARLEIKKAELALDEARQNKSNLRLRRDSQGNYSYQYTSDEEQLEEAEDKILTAKKDWYELVKKRNQETAEAVMDIRSRMAQAEQDMADAVLAHDTEAWETAHDTWVELQDMMKDYMGQAEKAKQDFFWGTAQFFSDVENNTMLPMWQTTVEQMIDEWDNGGEDSFIGAAQAAITRLDEATKTFSDHTADYLDAAGVKYQDVTEQGIDPMEEALRNMTGTNEELSESLSDTNKLLEDMEDDLQDAIKAYEDLKTAAVDAIKAANSAIETLAKTVVSSVNQMNAAISAAESAASLTASRANTSTSNSSSSGGYRPDGAFGSTQSSNYHVVDDPYGSGYGHTKAIADSSGNYVVIVDKDKISQSYKDQLEEKYKVSLRTGGYTGEWGDTSGRLAVLHQKELVLNQNDTSNMLNAVNALRDIVGSNSSADFSGLADAITASAYMSAQVLAQVGSGIVQSIASLVNDNSNINNYKNMTVNADFSGVRSADAIYQALVELDNYGNQQSYSSAPHANTSY